MNSRNLSTPRKKSPFKMDIKSDRYRICPNDGVEFMAIHRSEKFCHEKCADEFHNQKKRLMVGNQMQLEINEALNAPVPLPSNIPKEEMKPELIIEPNDLIKNIQLLGATLGNLPDITIHENHLTNIGVKLAVYDGQYILPNTELNVITYGPFALAWGYENQYVLTYKKNIPWMQ